MSAGPLLTPEEVVERYRGFVTVGTLANWRVKRIGPDFLKVGKAVLYPVAALEAWDAQNRVACRRSKGRERLASRDAEAPQHDSPHSPTPAVG